MPFDLSTNQDRRQHQNLRAAFAEAFDILRPFLDPANDRNGHSHDHLALRAMRERFPEMSKDEIFVLVAAARRTLIRRAAAAC
ncbi:MAG: hypothetical protein JSR19_06145 [Proteobacteria bacterium]|nr:hypothetical protein [Pseudomonadota bacterium]HQR04751.1 hypothetical protein [Rhodocyclaceae bacterium]